VGDHFATSVDASVSQLGSALSPYEAVLLVSFGGPERPEDVMPFLQNVTRGRGIPTERLVEVSQHYLLFGGKSPINDQCRSLLSALTNELRNRGIELPLYWGNRNWNRENLFDAAQDTEVQIDRIRHYANHPGFVAASVDASLTALQTLGDLADDARLVFVTHSIPLTMAQTAGPMPRSPSGGYVDWHTVVAAEITDRVSEHRGRRHESDLVYCSRSGPPNQRWLEPDINDHLRQLAADGVPAVVVVPIGFVSDHMEVVYDLDTEAAATAEECGLAFARAASAGDHPAFVSGLVDLMVERAAVARGEQPARPVVNAGKVGWYECWTDCCPNLREPGRPTLCEVAG
jgi:ferrochelatase